MNVPELKKSYLDEVMPALMKNLGCSNVHQLPKIEKVVINSSFGVELDKNGIEELRKDIAALAGQSPIVIKAKVSVSNFKLRQGMPVGVKVTLRGNRMWEFLLRLIAIALPNIRDFRGVSSKLDGHGNYTLGIIDHSIFPEINVERQRVNTGMDICIVTSAQSDHEAIELLKHLGMPFRKHSSDSNPVQAAA
ncbi:MAG: 50S ribosomal protein L5 [Opitutae bacterium]|nr:50S ribosomal protein L5 [Opitutae bacterium]|tara:strand:- start:6627 stop:7202 length:576 start_codon:yes stop_codon:yes gene_type:complete